jgi:hypothetical protein
MIGRCTILSDKHSAELLVLQEPAALANGDVIRGRSVWIVLVPFAAVSPEDTKFDDITCGPVLIDLCFADETNARLLDRVCADVDIALGAVVPPGNLFADPARYGQADLAIAFPGCRRFEFRDTLFQNGASIATKIGSFIRL